MQLTVWTYEGPPHVGAMRIATAMEGVHYVLHAPQGDTYADLLFTMIERRGKRPPVTYTTFQARDLGGDTAGLFQTRGARAYERFQPQAMLVGASCTARADPGRSGRPRPGAEPSRPGLPLELPSYQKKENWGAAETFYQLVRAFAVPPRQSARNESSAPARAATSWAPRHSASAIATMSREIARLLGRLGIAVNVMAPLGASPADLARLGEADFNVVLYPEIAGTAARGWSAPSPARSPRRCPIGVGATRDFIAEVAALAGVDPAPVLDDERSRLPWYSRSVDFDLSHRQARLHLRRRDPRHRRRPRRRRRARLHGGRARHLYARIRPRGARGRRSYTASRP